MPSAAGAALDPSEPPTALPVLGVGGRGQLVQASCRGGVSTASSMIVAAEGALRWCLSCTPGGCISPTIFFLEVHQGIVAAGQWQGGTTRRGGWLWWELFFASYSAECHWRVEMGVAFLVLVFWCCYGLCRCWGRVRPTQELPLGPSWVLAVLFN